MPSRTKKSLMQISDHGKPNFTNRSYKIVWINETFDVPAVPPESSQSIIDRSMQASNDVHSFFSEDLVKLPNHLVIFVKCFLVGAFLGKSARLLQWLVFFSFFFVRLQSHSDWATFLTIETTKTTTIRPSPVSGN